MNFLNVLCLMLIWTCSSGNVVIGPRESVSREEYVYYNFSSLNSYVYLQLDTVVGDCDLYVSETQQYPTFDNYSLHSATCGVDSVLVLKRSKGPVYIGMYGHPAFEKSECTLKVCLLDRPEENDLNDVLTEMTELSEKISELCQMPKNPGPSFLGRMAYVFHRIEMDGFLLEVVSALAEILL